MEPTKQEKARLRRLADTYRTAQERARDALLGYARELIEVENYPLTRIAEIAGMSKQALWDQLYRTPKAGE